MWFERSRAGDLEMRKERNGLLISMTGVPSLWLFTEYGTNGMRKTIRKEEKERVRESVCVNVMRESEITLNTMLIDLRYCPFLVLCSDAGEAS